jgi:hypothetical protein
MQDNDRIGEPDQHDRTIVTSTPRAATAAGSKGARLLSTDPSALTVQDVAST